MPLGKPSGGSAEPPRRLPLSKETEDDEARSSTLWVGNLSLDTADSDLMAVFGKHGALDCTMMRGSRSYAFMYFRGVDEAKAAKNSLQGAAIRGSAVRIEFARPAKAAKQIWVGGFSSSISKEQLREEFSKYGKFEDYKFFRDRNSAIIEYYKLEDAISAHKNINGKLLGGEQLRIDFVRFQPPRRDWPDRIDSRSGHIMNHTAGLFPPDNVRSFHDQTYLAAKRNMPPEGRIDPQPSNVLWIGYPPSVQVDEQMLHNAMILFGEIERIKCFPSRHHAFVEFRSFDEARRAKEGLQGRLFNDPRIQILFSGSETTSKDNPSLLSALTELRPGLFVNEGSFGALDLLAHGRPVVPNAFPGSLHPTGISGTNVSTRPFGTQNYDPYHAGSDLHDIDCAPHNFSDSDTGKSATTSWRNRSPSAPGILPSPGMRPHVRPFPDGRDGFDTQETKRTRIEGSSGDDWFYPMRRLDGAGNLVSGFAQPPSNRSRFSPMIHERSPDIDYCWRGIIAKGGSHVCHARCIQMGKGIECPLPGMVNCSARTGLDMLTKHYAEAVGFDIAFFLPDSEEDFASYTEFLRYLGSKDRAGVAKLDDGTTLFLVPPSDFLSKILKINGPERLYGVVLKFPQQSLTAVPQQSQSSLPHGLLQYTDQQDPYNLQKDYTYIPQNEERAMKIGYSKPLDEVVTHSSIMGHAEMQHATQSSARDQVSNPVAISKAEASLPPELLATLASLIPKNPQALTVQLPSTSLTGPATSASMLNDLSMPYPKLQEHQISHSAAPSMEFPTYLPHHLSQQFSTQALSSQFPTYINGPAAADQTVQTITGSSQAHNPLTNIQQTPSILSRPLNNYGISQNGQLSGHNNPHYPYGTSSSSQNNYGPLVAANASDVIVPGVQLPPGPSFPYHDQISNIPPVQTQSSLPSSRSNADVATGQHGQSILPGPSQGTLQGDADKNQRYQSTLQFAANLLFQIQQQQQQQAKNQAEQGSGNQP